MYLQTINRTIPETLVAMTRSGLFFIPLVYILGSTMNILGLEMAQMFADIGAVLFALPFALYALKSMSGTKELATHLE
jgi:Na+-driven multidrug efflux pump